MCVCVLKCVEGLTYYFQEYFEVFLRFGSITLKGFQEHLLLCALLSDSPQTAKKGRW